MRLSPVKSFALYDWANSAYITILVTALGGPYITALATADATNGEVSLLGVGVSAGALWAYATSFSVILQILTLPILGSLGDRGHKKKLLMGLTLAGGVLSVLFSQSTTWETAVIMIVLANVCYGGAITLYNAFLGEVSEGRDTHKVSSQAFAAGYLGGGVALLVALGLVLRSEPLGLTQGEATSYAMLGAGVWWMLFGLWSIRGLPEVPRALEPSSIKKDLKEGLVLLKELPQTRRFLLGFLLYNDAIQAVISLSAVYLTHELYTSQGRDASEATTFVIGLILVIQFVGILGALFYGKLAARIGPKPALVSSLVIWIGAILFAAVILSTHVHAWILGVVIALVLGGSQALARSLYTELLPEGKEAIFFSLYEVAERGTAWVGTLLFAVVLDVTGSYRGAIGSLVILLVLGTILLVRTDIEAGKKAVGHGQAPSGALPDGQEDEALELQRP